MKSSLTVSHLCVIFIDGVSHGSHCSWWWRLVCGTLTFNSIIKLCSFPFSQRVSVMRMTDMEMTEWDTQVKINYGFIKFVLISGNHLVTSWSGPHDPSGGSDPNFGNPRYRLKFQTVSLFSWFSSLLSPRPHDSGDFSFQVPPPLTFHQTSQDSPSHSAAQMRCSESFLVARIPLLTSLVSCQDQAILYVMVLLAFIFFIFWIVKLLFSEQLNMCWLVRWYI